MDRPYRRIVLIALIAVFLSVALPAVAVAAEPAAAAKTGKDVRYAALFLNDKKAGYVKTERTYAPDQVTTTEMMTMSIDRGSVDRGGGIMDITVEQTEIETRDGQPKAFRMVRTIGSGPQAIPQTYDGVIKPDGTLEVTISVGNGGTTRKLDWPDGARMSYGLELLAKEKGLKPGTSYTATIFSTETLSPLEMRTVVGETTQIDVFETKRTVVKLDQTMQAPLGKMTSTTYIDPRTFQPVQAVIPMMGMTMKIVECDKAFAMSPAEDVGELFRQLNLTAPQPVDPSANELVYIIEPTSDEAELAFAQADFQSVKKDGTRLMITVRKPAWPAGGELPYTGKDEAVTQYLKPSDYVQSDDKDIRELAARITRDVKTPAAAAKKIEAYVSRHITQKDLGVGYASAVEVLKSRRGDCTEHAVLTAALCRAAGIPAQVVDGVAWIGEWDGQKNVFVAHAWNQVYVDGRWVPIDAALLAYRPVGTGRLMMTIGDGDTNAFMGIINTLGNFRIVEVRAAD